VSWPLTFNLHQTSDIILEGRRSVCLCWSNRPWPHAGSGALRIGRFLAGRRKGARNQDVVNFVSYAVVLFLFCVSGVCSVLLPCFVCQYHCNRWPGKTHLRNDLLCVEWNVKPYTHTQSNRPCFCCCIYSVDMQLRHYSLRSSALGLLSSRWTLLWGSFSWSTDKTLRVSRKSPFICYLCGTCMYRTIGSELPGYCMTDQIPNVGKLIGVIFSVRSTLRPLHLSQMSMDWIHHELGWVFSLFKGLEQVGSNKKNP